MKIMIKGTRKKSVENSTLSGGVRTESLSTLSKIKKIKK